MKLLAEMHCRRSANAARSAYALASRAPLTPYSRMSQPSQPRRPSCATPSMFGSTSRSSSFTPPPPPLHGAEQWQVHKFGGASLGDAAKIKACGDLLITEARGDGNYVPTAAVVSAMKGMTSHFVDMANLATQADGEKEALEKLAAIFKRQVDTIHELVGSKRPDIAERVIANIELDRTGLVTMLKSFKSYGEVPTSAMAYIAGTGEVWSAQTLCAYLQMKEVPTQWLNAREVLIVESEGGLGEKGAALDMSVKPLYDVTAKNLENWWATKGKPMHEGDPIMIITGFVASSPKGVCTTLKRSGSDHSATIFAYLLKASRVTLWKEMDGIFTADPRRVPTAGPLCSLSYKEASEIAYFGGEVLHPAATEPCLIEKIPIYVRNFCNPACPGTVISTSSRTDNDYLGAVKGVTHIENIAMVHINAGSWGSVAKVTERAMAAMNEAGVKVVLITQNSSSHALTFAIDEAEAERSLAAVKKAFELELLHQSIEGVSVDSGYSLLSLIMSNVKNQAGLAVPLFRGLGRIRCNIAATGQGSSDNAVSVVVSKEDLPRALHVAHAAYEPLADDMSVFVIGKGTVGGELLDQIRGYQTHDPQGKLHFQETDPVGVRVLGVADSSKMVLHETGLCLDDGLKSAFETEGSIVAESDINHLTDFMVRKAPSAVIVDCTASNEIASKYPKWLEKGLHVVSANKKGGCADWDLYCRTFNAARKGKSNWLYEASVGSGLLVSTIRDLRRTGDRIDTIEGVFSGTLSSLFHRMADGNAFSDAVQRLYEKEHTEPDPRDDLSGLDVQRKVVILAREAGLELNLEDVQVESLVPEPLQAWTPPSGEDVGMAFIKELRAFDDNFAQKVSYATSEVLRYVGIVDVEKGTARVELRRYPTSHPFAQLQGIDNACLFHTERFSPQPLMVRGPGTGRGVIAGGVFADLLRLGSVIRST